MANLTGNDLTCDYLVIGCGAAGMAFVDTMLSESDATFVIVDNHGAPGGHWNDAYPFVRLHQPSAFYGVSSTELGSGRIDTDGPNKGFYELASGAEILAYFDKVMREVFIPSGRVTYLSMHDYEGGADARKGIARSTISGEVTEITVEKNTVDSSFFKTSVPSTHTRSYTNVAGTTVIPPNDLPRRAADFAHYCVIGAGKTAMDALIWLLTHGATPDNLSWVCPRTSWLINRATTQPGIEFFKGSIGGFAAQLEAAATATSVDDLFLRMEKAGVMIRIDTGEIPTMFHYATISEGEVAALRSVKNVIRAGRVAHISKAGLEMQSGEEVAMPANTLYVDCTASAVKFAAEPDRPIFTDTMITLQAVRAPLVSYSAAIIGYLEANYDDMQKKNAMATPIMLADTPREWMISFFGNMLNQQAMSGEAGIQAWGQKDRLDPFSTVARSANMGDPEQAAIMKRLSDNAMPAAMNLQKLIAETAG